MDARPLITVVVCTRNRSASLRSALRSLANLQTGAAFDFEILVVDNGSTDDTPEVVAAANCGSAVAVRLVTEPRAGIVPARNRGVSEAHGRWIAFFDDDQLADAHWLKELFDTAQARQCRCAGGAVLLKLPDGVKRKLAPISRMLLGETVGMTVARQYSGRVTPGCGNLMVERSVFDEVGMFDARMVDRGEDTEFFLRLLNRGIDGWFTPTAIVHHVIPESRLADGFLLNLATRMARGMAENERETYGHLRYPLIWAARVGQAALVLLPRFLLAWARNAREAALGAKCRLRIPADVLRDGMRLMLHRQRRSVHSNNGADFLRVARPQ